MRGKLRLLSKPGAMAANWARRALLRLNLRIDSVLLQGAKKAPLGVCLSQQVVGIGDTSWLKRLRKLGAKIYQQSE
ncbi:MAG: hypothetical protein WA985_07860 [Erythrobacter sp.]